MPYPEGIRPPHARAVQDRHPAREVHGLFGMRPSAVDGIHTRERERAEESSGHGHEEVIQEHPSEQHEELQVLRIDRRPRSHKLDIRGIREGRTASHDIHIEIQRCAIRGPVLWSLSNQEPIGRHRISQGLHIRVLLEVHAPRARYRGVHRHAEPRPTV